MKTFKYSDVKSIVLDEEAVEGLGEIFQSKIKLFAPEGLKIIIFSTGVTLVVTDHDPEGSMTIFFETIDDEKRLLYADSITVKNKYLRSMLRSSAYELSAG